MARTLCGTTKRWVAGADVKIGDIVNRSLSSTPAMPSFHRISAVRAPQLSPEVCSSGKPELELCDSQTGAEIRRDDSHTGIPHILSKKSCIDLLKSCKSMIELKQIQARALTLGHYRSLDVLHKLMAFAADPCLGNLDHALRIFERCENPTLFVYNVMIKAHAKIGEFRKALFLFHELRQRGLCPDNYTYPFVFKAIGELRMVREGEKTHAYVVKNGDGFDCYVCNSIMDFYGGVGFVGGLRKFFEEMPERDTVSWNILIAGYVRGTKYEHAIGVYKAMMMLQDRHVKPNEATVVSTLSACTALRNLELGKQIHDYVNSELELTVVIGNALLDMYAKCSCLTVARQIFDSLPQKNVICWTSMVSGYLSSGQLDEARELFQRSPSRDVVLWTAMINGYVQFKRVDEALILFKEMQMANIKPDKYTVVALLTGCAQLGALEKGRWLHACIEENMIDVDAVVGTALIEMYSKCGLVEESLEIFHALKKKEKDSTSWTAIICGLAMNGESNKALRMYSEMKNAGIKPDGITFIGVLSACSHGGLVEEGRRHFDSMATTFQIEPMLEHYGCLIDILGRAGQLEEAQGIIEKIPKGNDDNEILITLYGTLLSACRIHGDVDLGERISKKLMQMSCNDDSGAHSLLASIYASANRWEDVKKVRSSMKLGGFHKSPGYSSIELIQDSITGPPVLLAGLEPEGLTSVA